MGQFLLETHSVTKEHVLREVIWNNQFLRTGGKPLFCKKPYSKGIISLANVLTNNGKLKHWSFFESKGLNVNDYLIFLGLFNSIPSPWKSLLNSTAERFDASTISQGSKLDYSLYSDVNVSLDSLTSSKLYWKLVELIQVFPSARYKFISLFPDTYLDWDVIYLIPHLVTLDTKTRIFQYKLLNRIIYTNTTLYKMKLVGSPLCTFCKTQEESLEYLFCRCNFAIAFWRSVVLWIRTLYIDIDFLKDSDIIFGLTQKRPHWSLLNHIIITGKQIIYQNRLELSLPLLFHVTNKLKYIECIERTIAKKNNKLTIHSEKWKPLIDSERTIV